MSPTSDVEVKTLFARAEAASMAPLEIARWREELDPFKLDTCGCKASAKAAIVVGPLAALAAIFDCRTFCYVRRRRRGRYARSWYRREGRWSPHSGQAALKASGHPRATRARTRLAVLKPRGSGCRCAAGPRASRLDASVSSELCALSHL